MRIQQLGRTWYLLLLIVLCFLVVIALIRREIIKENNNHAFHLASKYAVDEIKNNQHQQGFWLTQFTSKPVFTSPTEEVNTFLPAIMVDILEPIAQDSHLNVVVEKAREFEILQIEHTGLVRYLGGPNLPSRRCVIVPDVDDSALAWTLAAPDGIDDARLPLFFGALSKYKTENGLYRTWIDPFDKTPPCVNPGRIPNPVDAVIQMNLILFFAKYSPEDMNELCQSLHLVIHESEYWVYYSITPLVPVLRQPLLKNVGCEIKIPEERISQALLSQKVWITAAQLLNGEQSSESDVIAVLNDLSRNNFEIMKIAPPLLYHNDVTASTPRFYWSPDVGYAIWLRLYYHALSQNIIQ